MTDIDMRFACVSLAHETLRTYPPTTAQLLERAEAIYEFVMGGEEEDTADLEDDDREIPIDEEVPLSRLLGEIEPGYEH